LSLQSFLTPKQTLTEKTQTELEIEEENWIPLDNDLFFPKDKVFQEGEQVGIGRCVGTVQVSPERLLGFYWNTNSDERMENHVKSNGPNQDLYPYKTM